MDNINIKEINKLFEDALSNGLEAVDIVEPQTCGEEIKIEAILRQSIAEEEQSIANYLKRAQKSCDCNMDKLCETFKEIAADEEQHVQMLQHVLQDYGMSDPQIEMEAVGELNTIQENSRHFVNTEYEHTGLKVDYYRFGGSKPYKVVPIDKDWFSAPYSCPRFRTLRQAQSYIANPKQEVNEGVNIVDDINRMVEYLYGPIGTGVGNFYVQGGRIGGWFVYKIINEGGGVSQMLYAETRSKLYEYLDAIETYVTRAKRGNYNLPESMNEVSDELVTKVSIKREQNLEVANKNYSENPNNSNKESVKEAEQKLDNNKKLVRARNKRKQK